MLKGYETIEKLAKKYKMTKGAIRYHLQSGKIRNRLFPVQGTKAQRIIHTEDLKKYLNRKYRG